MGDSLSPNRPYMKFAALHNTSLGFNSFDKEQISFIAGSFVNAFIASMISMQPAQVILM